MLQLKKKLFTVCSSCSPNHTFQRECSNTLVFQWFWNYSGGTGCNKMPNYLFFCMLQHKSLIFTVLSSCSPIVSANIHNTLLFFRWGFERVVVVRALKNRLNCTPFKLFGITTYFNKTQLFAMFFCVLQPKTLILRMFCNARTKIIGICNVLPQCMHKTNARIKHWKLQRFCSAIFGKNMSVLVLFSQFLCRG